MEFYYFDWIAIMMYDSSLVEFLYWIDLVKYNIESIYCKLYKMQNYISNINFIMLSKMQPFVFFKRLYNYRVYAYYFRTFKTKRKKRSLIMFLNDRVNSLLLKWLFSPELLIFEYCSFSVFIEKQILARRWAIRNYIRFFKTYYFWSLLYRWRVLNW